jgi:hypothetical protein
MRLDGMLKRLEALESDLGTLADAEAKAFIEAVSDAELKAIIRWVDSVNGKLTTEQAEADRLRSRWMPQAELNRILKPQIEYWRSIGSPSA